jgi:hypothetical protein
VPGGLQVDVDGMPHSADVVLALAQDNGASQVAAGENAGRTMRHVAILRSLRKLGTAKKGAGFHQTVDLPAEAAVSRVIIFVQDADAGRVWGAALLEK